MDKADFIHLVRLSEHASAENSGAYRRSLARFAALGYLWVVVCFVLAIVLLVMSGKALLQGPVKGYWVMLLLSGVGLLWSSVRALWLRLEAPEGSPLTPADAPLLFEALERIRKKTQGPPIHHVLLDSSFNASISQLPRFGLLGGATNYLTIGLPLLLALDRPRFLAVMAHEYGHLRGGHGQFAAWIYRTRMSWTKLYESMEEDAGLMAHATQTFLRWYFPRFMAKTFALARQDEYEADRIACKLLGRDVTGAALAEIAVKGAWLGREFWPLHWASAGRSLQPMGPFSAMRVLLTQPVRDDFARDALRQSLKEMSNLDDTHPVLRDRLEAMGARKELPQWSAKPAIDLLGASANTWLQRMDQQWCRDNASDWKLHHAYLRRVEERVQTLQASLLRNNADELTQLGDLKRRLDATADVRDCYARALQLAPNHPGALRGMVRTLPDTDVAGRLDGLNRLVEVHAASTWWAASTAVQMLEPLVAAGQPYDPLLKQWRARLKQADEAEQRAWNEMVDTPYFQSITRHDLNDFETGELQADLARCKPLRRAWLVRKNLQEFAYRRCYILFVELPGLPDGERYALCRSLERSLDLPGPVLVLWAGTDPTLQDIQKNTFDVTFARSVA